MKVCSICEQSLPYECFDMQSTGKDGRRADCKECRKRFIRSERGLAKQKYNQQIAKSKERGHNPPSYTEEEFYNWMIGQSNFKELYTNWVNSNYSTNLSPSADRLDDYKPYTLDNIRLVTWEVNNTRGRSDVFNGINNKPNIVVIQYSLDGQFITEHYSISTAARAVNTLPSNIRNACVGYVIHKGKRKPVLSSMGYVWKFK